MNTAYEDEMGHYTEIRSKYIRQLVGRTSWRDAQARTYVESLITLERFILRGISGFVSGIYYDHLKSGFRKEWEIICGELRPEKLKSELNKEKEHRQHEEEIRRRLKREGNHN